MTGSHHQSSYSVEDPEKIQGRDEVAPNDRSLGGLRLMRALEAIPDSARDILLPGAGAGRYARALARARPGSRIHGGDLSHAAVEEARAAGGGPTYEVFDAEEIPLADGSFDAVVFFDLLEHLPHPDKLLSESRRVLRPGGILHFFVPLEDQPRTLYTLFDNDQPIPIHRWKLDHVGHVQRFSDTDVLQRVWEAGFEVRDVHYSFHLIGQVHDFVDYWQRDRNRGGGGLLPLAAVNAIARGVFLFTWRLAYIEDELFQFRALAAGLHVTATSIGAE